MPKRLRVALLIESSNAYARGLLEGIAAYVRRPLPVSWQAEHARLVRWVAALPRPVGILACYDIKAQQLLAACRAAGVAVPEEVAVLGVDNDPVLCELCDPPLSSVIPDARGT